MGAHLLRKNLLYLSTVDLQSMFTEGKQLTDQLTQDIADLQATAQTEAGEITELQGQSASQQSTIASLQTQVSADETTISADQAQIASLEAQLATATAAPAVDPNTIAALETAIALAKKNTAAVAALILPVPTSIVVTPNNNNTFTPGQVVQFSGTVLDQHGDPLATQPAITWTCTTPANITPAGLYTAPSPLAEGTDIVTASSAPAQPTGVYVTLVAALAPPVSSTPTVASVTVSPQSQSVVQGTTQQFTAAVGLSDGTTETNFTPAWSVDNGSIDTSGVYTPGSVGSYTVTCNVAGVIGTSSGSVSAAVTS